MRYDYGTYKTQERAELALEDMFASGDVVEGEFPRIEKRGGKTASWSKAKYRFVISLGDRDA